MRIIHPSIVGHFDSKGGRCAIYSVDLQPRGWRLATAGGDCAVKLWDMRKLVAAGEVEGVGGTEESALLATCTTHEKSVNIVRWSPDGQFLASGGDDNYILIHRQMQVSGGAIAGEVWTRCLLLQGHRLNVLHLAWSHSGSLLASASMDNRVLLWNLFNSSQGGGEGVVQSAAFELSGHNCHVKGLAWDPLDRFLLSLDANNHLLVWDSQKGFAQCNSVPSVPENAPDVSLFRRLDFSPDGLAACLPCGLKKGKDVAIILSRGEWSSVADLVGHRAVVTCARFSPRLFHSVTTSVPASSTSSASVSTPTGHTLLCLGDLSGSLSIWTSQRSRPEVVLSEAFSGQVVDLSWLSGNDVLGMDSARDLVAACAITGEVLLIDLTAPSIRRELTAEERTAHLLTRLPAERTGHGDLVHVPSVLAFQGHDLQTEPASLPSLALTAEQDPSSNASLTALVAPILPPCFPNPAATIGVSQSLSGSFKADSTTSMETLREQVVEHIGNGKKRIRPVLLTASQPVPSNNRKLPQERGETPDAARGPISKTPRRENPSEGLLLKVILRGEKVNLDLLCPALSMRESSQISARVQFLSSNVLNSPASSSGNSSHYGADCVHEVVVERVTKPSALVKLPRSGGPLCVVRCLRVDKGVYWTSCLACEAVSIAAYRWRERRKKQDEQMLEPHESINKGIVLVGGLDGSFHIIDLFSGLKLLPPAILGAAIAHINVCLLKGEGKGLRLLVLCADGKMHLFDLIAEIKLHRVLSCELQPLWVSLKTTLRVAQLEREGGKRGEDLNLESEEQEFRLSVLRCYLHPVRLMPVVSLYFSSSKEEMLGHYDVFLFDTTMQCWQRLSGSEHLMSHLFVLSSPSLPVLRPFPSSDFGLKSGSIEEWEREVEQGIAVGQGELLDIVRARGSTLSSSSTDRATLTAIEWSSLATLAHAEDRFLTALDDNAVDSVLRDFVRVCCRCQATHKVEWLVCTLLRNSSFIREDLCEDVNGLLSWCEKKRSDGEGAKIVQEVIMPAVGSEKDVQAQLLLGHIVEALKSSLSS
eukprot:scaffold865_cov160-Ochromonas_danica.AAC.30